MIPALVLALSALVPSALGTADDRVAPSALGAADDRVAPSALGAADTRVAPSALGAADDRVAPSALGAADDRVAPSTLGAPEIKWDAQKMLLVGGSLIVHAEITAPKDGAEVPSWMLEPGAFSVDGKPLGERSTGLLKLGPNGKISVDLDLGPAIAGLKDMEHKSFKLTYGNENNGTKPIEVMYLQAAEKGLDFMKMSPDELAKYHVILQTNRGDLELEFWPDMAPKHVANFLDLAYTGFYNGSTFHRVIPGFMIQGGDPTGTGDGKGPRTLNAEFNARRHEPGVLSMAREPSPDSASCQFFILNAKAPHLDGQYTAFGKLVTGLDVVSKIISVNRDAKDKPREPQTILKAIVVRIPGQ